MRYLYRCRVCRTVTGHASEREAQAERVDHAERAHHGRWPEDDEITGPHAKPRPVDGYVRAWLDRHDRIIGRAMWQFWVLAMLAGPLYLLYTHLFG
ncbi:hypothetical protein GXW83_27405 [Streptacidiphilus sp. PB12-B1b]|nr:hypothetical protein GXW83_27405 [Streptacidiphilus sp. PB12-B1b]